MLATNISGETGGVMESEIRKPWSVATTLAWAALALVIGQGAAMATLVWWMGHSATHGLSLVHYDGTVLALATLVADPLQIAILAWAVRLRGSSVADYLALGSFRTRDFGVSLATTAALVLAISGFGWLAGQELVTSFQTESYASTPSLAWLAALCVAVIIVAPLGEEIMFRGFVFRGLVRAHDHPVWGIVVIAVLWAALHIQYDWFGLLQVFLLGILLGWARWRSGSTTLAFVLHALINLESAVETVIKVGWTF